MRLLMTAIVVPLVALLALVSCEKDQPVAPLPTADSQEIVFREFLPEMQAALRRRDVMFFVDRMKTVDIVCRAEDMQGLGGPACEYVGQRFTGFEIWRWRSEGGIVPVSDVQTLFSGFFDTLQVSAGDEFGDGDAQVYALSEDGSEYSAIVTGMIERPANFAGSGPLRVSLGTTWSFEGGRWVLARIMTAYVGGEELLRPDPEVREYIYSHWERYVAPK